MLWMKEFDWVLLTNGQQFNLYRVIFEKPLQIKDVISIDLKADPIIKATDQLMYLSKKSVSKGYLEKFWEMHQATTPKNLAQYLYKEEMITCSHEEIFDSIHEVVINCIQFTKLAKLLKYPVTSQHLHIFAKIDFQTCAFKVVFTIVHLHLDGAKLNKLIHL